MKALLMLSDFANITNIDQLGVICAYHVILLPNVWGI